jgi:hypothetical protein
MGRGTVNRQVQVGVETTPGTAVAANKVLPSMSMTITPQTRTKEIRSQGFKPVTDLQQLGGFSEIALTGPLNYTEIIYILNMIVTGVITTPGGGTTSRQHTFSPTAQGTDAFKTLTVQEGDSTAATQAAGTFLKDWGFSAADGGVDITGTLNGRYPTAVSLTGSPTSVAQLPVSPREIDIYIDPTFGAIGTTKVTDGLNLSYGITDKQAMKFVLNTTFSSYSESIEVVPTQTWSFITEHNAQSRAIFALISTGNAVQYMRMKATGPLIEAAINYKFQIDVPVKIKATVQEDNDGVWGYRYDCMPKYDSAFGNKLWEIQVINTITAL